MGLFKKVKNGIKRIGKKIYNGIRKVLNVFRRIIHEVFDNFCGKWCIAFFCSMLLINLALPVPIIGTGLTIGLTCIIVIVGLVEISDRYYPIYPNNR